MEPVYLIVDGHPMHKSKKVKEYVRSTEGNFEVILLATLFT